MTVTPTSDPLPGVVAIGGSAGGVEPLGPSSGFNCPDCNGPLQTVDEGNYGQ